MASDQVEVGEREKVHKCSISETVCPDIAASGTNVDR
jgi:hypothetical protein